MSEASNAAPVAAPAPAATEAAPVAQETNTAQAEEAITPEETAELAAEEAKAAQAQKEASVKVKVKIDGEEVELTQEELKKYASLGKAAQKRMQEAALSRKEHEEYRQKVDLVLQTLKNDPARVLSDLGVDPKKFAEDFINRQLEEEAKSPEQKEKEKLLKDLEDAQKKIKEVEETSKKKEFEKIQNEMASKIEKDINEAIESGAMPKAPRMIRTVADLLSLAAAQGVDLDARDVIPLAKKQLIEEFRELTKVSSEEVLEEMLGDDKVASLRRRYIKKLKPSPTTPKDIKSTGQEVKQSDKPKDKISAKDFFKKIGR